MTTETAETAAETNIVEGTEMTTAVEVIDMGEIETEIEVIEETIEDTIEDDLSFDEIASAPTAMSVINRPEIPEL